MGEEDRGWTGHMTRMGEVEDETEEGEQRGKRMGQEKRRDRWRRWYSEVDWEK